MRKSSLVYDLPKDYLYYVKQRTGTDLLTGMIHILNFLSNIQKGYC